MEKSVPFSETVCVDNRFTDAWNLRGTFCRCDHEGTDMTNQIEAENHDFKIMTDMSSGTISQYPTEETYFPEDLIEKMTGLDGVETVAKVTGGYGKLQLDEKSWIFEERR